LIQAHQLCLEKKMTRGNSFATTLRCLGNS
jgi:hypothetical protein